MSQENVEAVKRGIYAFNCRDMEGLLAELDPAVEWHPALLAALRGEGAAVYQGHEGVRDFVRDLHEAFTELQIEIVEARVDVDHGLRRLRRFRQQVGARPVGAAPARRHVVAQEPPQGMGGQRDQEHHEYDEEEAQDQHSPKR